MRQASNTIFAFSSLSGILTGGGALLVCLLVLVRPEASQGLGAIQRTLFWTLHVGAGIAAMFIASMLVRHSRLNQLSVLPSVILCGLLGTLLITPLYLLIDQLWPVTTAEEIDDWLDALGQSGFTGSLLAEFLEVLPWTMTAWLMINLPLLNKPLLDQLTGAPHNQDQDISLENAVRPLAPEQVNTMISNSAEPQSPSNKSVAIDSTAQQSHPDINAPALDKAPLLDKVPALNTPEADNGFLQSLPGIFGKDIIAISSDLHYLNVFTLVGKTTVLGNLRDVASELKDSGLQVHRSHWVAHKHVNRIVNTGGQAACIMSNGLRVPVSRRRWKAVREYYGQGVIQRT